MGEEDAAVVAVPVFSADDQPSAIVDGAGRWLAARLGPEFRWSTRDRVVRGEHAGFVVGFGLRGSSLNRAGGSTVVNVTVTVEDAGLGRWRRDHRSLCHRDHARLLASLLVNLVPAAVMVELYGPLRTHARQIMSLSDLPDALGVGVLDVVACLQRPADALRGLPDAWCAEPTGWVEWAVSRGDLDVAKRFVVRYLTLFPQRVPAFDHGRTTAGTGGITTPWDPDTALGRSAVALGLFTADEPVPVAAPPPRRRSLMQRLRGDR